MPFRSWHPVTFPQKTGLKSVVRCELTSFCRLSSSCWLRLRRWGLWENWGQASWNPLHPEEHPSRPDPAERRETKSLIQPSIIDCGYTGAPTSPQLTKSSSFMSLADSIHMFTVLGSRAGFSADMTHVTRCKHHPNQKIQQLLYNVFNISLCIKGKCWIFAAVCVMGEKPLVLV